MKYLPQQIGASAVGARAQKFLSKIQFKLILLVFALFRFL